MKNFSKFVSREVENDTIIGFILLMWVAGVVVSLLTLLFILSVYHPFIGMAIFASIGPVLYLFKRGSTDD